MSKIILPSLLTASHEFALEENGRGGEIRTHDLLYPKQARYQATLRPDTERSKLPTARGNCNSES
jgi:hypothetical protein